MNTTPTYANSEGLRALLHRLHSGQAGWNDPEADDLMAFTISKYGALARKHGLEPADAAAAAFEVMRTQAARNALDPLAVVTRAVQLTLTYVAEARACRATGVGRTKAFGGLLGRFPGSSSAWPAAPRP